VTAFEDEVVAVVCGEDVVAVVWAEEVTDGLGVAVM
jgi:hypothetical protein